MKIIDIITKLTQWHAPLDHPERTNDTVKYGNPEQECTGIAVTCFASVEVIRQAIEKGCNLIICHEPLFFGDGEQDAADPEDPVFREKCALLDQGNMVVWRDHDYMHGPGGPSAVIHKEIDYIYYGIMKELGWEAYVQGEQTKPLWYKIPETTVYELAREFMNKFDVCGIRVVGNQNARVSTVFFCEHVFGRPKDAQVIQKARDADVLVPLEIVDWTVTEYVQDACSLGYPKAILEMGHFNTEDLGMRYMAKWLPEVIGTDVHVEYMRAKDPFSYISR